MNAKIKGVIILWFHALHNNWSFLQTQAWSWIYSSWKHLYWSSKHLTVFMQASWFLCWQLQQYLEIYSLGMIVTGDFNDNV